MKYRCCKLKGRNKTDSAMTSPDLGMQSTFPPAASCPSLTDDGYSVAAPQ